MAMRRQKGIRHAGIANGAARDRGSASVQLVILMPALFLLMFTGMQAALIYHARTVAIAAAQEGARAAAAQWGTVDAGHAAAEAFIASAGGDDVLRGVTVTVAVDGAAATVTVTGDTLSVVPGWEPVVVQGAAAPIERITR